jgi:hypothetical protein
LGWWIGKGGLPALPGSSLGLAADPPGEGGVCWVGGLKRGANRPSPAARWGSLPTLPRRVESVGLADWVSFGRLVRRIGACDEDRGLGGCRGGFGGIDSTLLGRVAGERSEPAGRARSVKGSNAC